MTTTFKCAITIICVALMAMTGCKSSKKTAVNDETRAIASEEVSCIMPPKPGHDAPGTQYLPMARIYKTSGNFANNVPITLSADGSSIISFPAPTDITSTSAPVQMAGGFLLDRRGIGPNTAFTRYTYDEYRALPAPPTLKELKDAIIPGAYVTEIVTLPFPTSEATSDIKRVDTLIREGLPGCEKIYQAPTLKF